MCHFAVLVSFSGLLCVATTENVTGSDNIANLAVNSKFDLTGRFAKVNSTILFTNKNSATTRTYKYLFDNSDLHYIQFYNNPEAVELQYKKTLLNGSLVLYEIQLDEDVLENQQHVLISKIVYPNRIVPATKRRTINEDQLMKFKGNLQFLSLYPTNSFQVTFLVPDGSLMEVTKSPTMKTESKVVYIFDNNSVGSDFTKLVFINNIASIVVEELQRTIDVNHLGKITIKDEVTIYNRGPKFVGPYIVDNEPLRKAVALWFHTHLPASAENIQFFDILGNNSRSKVFYFRDHATLIFRSRYPLLGGWKTSYILKYQLPTHEYLFISKTGYFLKMRALDYVIDGQFIIRATIKIVLSEGASMTKVHLPEGLTFENEEKECFMGPCVFGRPIIVLNGSNLLDIHVDAVGVEYRFNNLHLLWRPLIFSVYLECVFLFVLFMKYCLA